MELIEYYYLFRKRLKLIIAVFLSIVILALIAIFSLTPIYQSSAKLLVSDTAKTSILSSIVNMSDMLGSGLIGKADPIATQIEIVKTRPIIRQVIRELEPYYYQQISSANEPLLTTEDLQKAIEVSAVHNTNIITISYRHPHQDFAALVVNTLSQEYVRNNRMINQQESRLAIDFIQEQMVEQYKTIKQAENALLAYQKQAGTVSLSKETELLVTQVSELSAEKIRLEATISAIEESVQGFEQRIARLQGHSSAFLAQWKARLNELESEYISNKATLASISAKIREINQTISALPPKEIQLTRLMSDAQIANEIYNNLQILLEEARISEAAKIASVRVIEEGIPGKYPVFPQKKKLLAIALVGGLMAGFGLALVLEYFDNHINSLDEIDHLTHWQRIGVIPHDDELKNNGELITNLPANSTTTESFSTLRTNIHYSSFDRPIKTILVTSANPGEGKTTITANLAVAYAILGKKTLLIDADFRKPRLHHIFSLSNQIGLTNVLPSELSIKDSINRTALEKLQVIGTGPIPPNPISLFESEKLNMVLAELKTQYDIILFDTPPSLAVSDTLILAHKVDAALFTVNLDICTRQALKQATHHFESLNIKPLGYIVNNLNLVGNRYYGYHYYSYKYSQA